MSELSGIIIVVNTPELALPDDYPHLLAELKAQIRSAQWTAARVVNTQVIELYWAIGKAILDRQNAAGWGAKVIDQLAVDLSLAFPDSKGFSRRNLHYMRRLAEAWPAPAFVQQPAAQMPWGHLMVVLDKLGVGEHSFDAWPIGGPEHLVWRVTGNRQTEADAHGRRDGGGPCLGLGG